MNGRAILTVLSDVNNKTKEYTHFILLLIVGSLAVYESIRITSMYSIKDWLSGPSGFVMIIGFLLLFLSFIEGLALIRLKRRKMQVLPLQASVAATLDALPVLSDKDLKYSKVREDIKEQFVQEDSRNTLNLIISYVLLIVYVITLKPLGFTLSTALYMTSSLLLLKNSWTLTAVTVMVLVAWIMFGAPAMGLSLPRGIFGF